MLSIVEMEAAAGPLGILPELFAFFSKARLLVLSGSVEAGVGGCLITAAREEVVVSAGDEEKLLPSVFADPSRQDLQG